MLVAEDAFAQRFEVGARGSIMLSDGEPANDVPGYGLFARWRWSERWAIGASVDRVEYDFEQPARLLGLQQDPNLDAIDALATATVVGVWVQRDSSAPSGRWSWFWGGGLAVASVDVPDARGPVAGGGTFDIRTEPNLEVIASILGGVQWRISRRLFLEVAARVEEHFADWEVTDRVSGLTGSVGSYFAYGGCIGGGVRF